MGEKASVPAITVVVTSYNLEKYVDRCLRELSGQTMRDFEVLFVDDASTDRTAALVEEWKPRFGGRLQTMYLPKNLGNSALTRNAVLDSGRIRGDYVLFLDGDDSIESNMLETLYAKAVESSPDATVGHDVVICAYDRVDDASGSTLSTELKGFPHEVVLPPEDDTIAFINTAPWNKLWRRDIVENLRFSDVQVGEEVIFNFNAYTKCKTICFVDETLIHYTIRNNSLFVKTNEESIWKFAQRLVEFYNMQQGIYQELAGILIFFHMGFSMALLAYDNPKIDIDKHITKTEHYFQDNFDWFQENRFLTFSSLRKRNIKGILIWSAFLAYRYRCFGLALKLYRKLGLRIKF